MKRGLPDVKGLIERVSVAERVSAFESMNPSDAVLVERLHLFALHKRLKKFTDKAAARPDAEQYLMANFGLLSHVKTLRDVVADMVETASNDDVRRLERVLRAAFYIGSLAPKDLKVEVDKVLGQRTQHARDVREQQVAEQSKTVLKMYKDMTKPQIAKALGISERTVQRAIAKDRKKKSKTGRSVRVSGFNNK
jgi:DNA-binding NarL/FixJ family response regulator